MTVWMARASRLGVAALLVALLLGASLVVGTPPVRADEITVSNFKVSSEDPTSITFSARVIAPATLEAASLLFRVRNPKEGDVGGTGRATFAPGAETDVTFTLETRSSVRYIPTGSHFVYQWELVDADGDTFLSEEQEFLFLDGRFSWETRTEGNITVYWYGGNEGLAVGVLGAAADAIADAEALLQAKVPYPIRIMVWASESEGELALRPRGGAFDEQVITGGQRVAPDLLFVLEASVDVVRHEATHIVTAVAGDGPFSRVPAWLDEGTAVYMQNELAGYGTALDLAIQLDRTLLLRSLQSPSNIPTEVNIFYGQSFSTVDFLIEEFGAQAFADVYRVVREGARIDDALEQVYGFDQDGLYNAWREFHGLQAVELAERPDPSTAPVSEATRAPLQIPTAVTADNEPSGDSEGTSGEAPAPGTPDDGTASGGGSDGGGGSVLWAVIWGLGALAIGGGLGLGALSLYRRSRAA